VTFPNVFIGGCTVPSPTKVFKIQNTGTDCLKLKPLAGTGPYTIQSTSKTLPVDLAPYEIVDVTVAFGPGAIGTFNNKLIAVPTEPVNGDTQFICNGVAVAAAFNISFSANPVSFGKVPLGTSDTKLLTIINSGTKAMAMSSTGVTADGFSVAPFSANLTCGQSFVVNIQFLPTSEGPHAASFSVTHSAPGNPTTINLTGIGCVANAELVVTAAPIDFGKVQQGF
jgi:Abnormal spindle-like microcephaly-assoc'd, ASPM-SPD-2-Hydin